MTTYKGFVLGFFNYIPRMYAYNESINISFGIGMTDIQKLAYDKMYGRESWKTILIDSMKHIINNYYNTNCSFK
jgi:hypothetical protein